MKSEDAERILTAIEGILEKAGNVLAYRALLAEAANKGDLDPSTDTFAAANKRADDFIAGRED